VSGSLLSKRARDEYGRHAHSSANGKQDRLESRKIGQKIL